MAACGCLERKSTAPSVFIQSAPVFVQSLWAILGYLNLLTFQIAACVVTVAPFHATNHISYGCGCCAYRYEGKHPPVGAQGEKTIKSKGAILVYHTTAVRVVIRHQNCQDFSLTAQAVLPNPPLCYWLLAFPSMMSLYSEPTSALCQTGGVSTTLIIIIIIKT